MRLAMANSFVTIVAAEMVAANDGLGVMIWNGRMFMLIDDIFAALLTLGALGFCCRSPVPHRHLSLRPALFAGDLR